MTAEVERAQVVLDAATTSAWSPPDTLTQRLNRALAVVDGLSAEPGDTPVVGSAVERLDALAALAQRVDQATKRTVREALDAGETWQSIGEALSVSRQAAHEKWSRRLTSS